MKRLATTALVACLAAACSPQSAPAPAAGEAALAPQTAAAASPAAAATGTGPLDGIWQCKMNGAIPLGTLTFAGGAYTFQTTNTAWEPTPNSSDGAGTVTFEDTFVLPIDGPLVTSFKVTGAFGDGSFINFNNNGGLLFGCRRP